MLRPRTPEEVREAVLAHPRLRVRGGGSKPALSQPEEGEALLDLSELRGVVEYDPEELVLVALAGTQVAEVEALLKAKSQHLPFHPPLSGQGATLGGTVAAGLSGPLAQRFGGVRDFLLGVRFVDGQGRLLRGGGKVVKNAAGFPFHRLMVGALGAFGVLVELAFKVFPAPPATRTLRVAFPSLEEALPALERLLLAPLDLMALDLLPPGTLEVRIGGFPEALGPRLEKLKRLLGREGEVLEEDEAHWEGVRNLAFLEGPLLLKVPSRLDLIPLLEGLPLGRRRYLMGGSVLYAEGDREALKALKAAGLAHLVLKGAEEDPLFPKPQDPFFRKVKAALDPMGRFPLR